MIASTQPTSASDQPIETACGNRLAYAPDIPQAIHDGRLVFFCLPACLRDFETDPAHSCLAEYPSSNT